MWSGCEGALCGVGVRVPYSGVGVRVALWWSGWGVG